MKISSQAAGVSTSLESRMDGNLRSRWICVRLPQIPESGFTTRSRRRRLLEADSPYLSDVNLRLGMRTRALPLQAGRTKDLHGIVGCVGVHTVPKD